MKRGIQGTLAKNSNIHESFISFIPFPLPPKPAIDISEIAKCLESANRAIGELNGVIEADINPSLINYMYVRKEAVLSSQIEGTQSTLNDLLRYEAAQKIGISIADVSEISSYVSALNHGLQRIADGFPLSLRLLREIHHILLNNTRGSERMPGTFRTSQNWIGGTRPGNAHFVPPPPDMVVPLLGDLEKFMHNQDSIPDLVKIALIHMQFETIHPFLDGNGRIGRLLITLFLCVKGYLKAPLLYASLFFKQHRDVYYDKLTAVRQNGDWEDWIQFFLEGIESGASDAKNTLLAIQCMFRKDDSAVMSLGRAAPSASCVLSAFKQKPMLSVAELTEKTGKSKPTVISSINHLMQLDIVKKAHEKKWGQIYSYAGYIRLLTPDTGITVAGARRQS
jgi:Fic family protein